MVVNPRTPHIEHKAVPVPPSFAIQLCESVENHKNLKPIWWCSYSFRFDMSNEDVISEFLNYCIRISRKYKAHIYPVMSIGRIPGESPHIHAVICSDAYLNYDQLHKNWRSGFSKQNLYRSGEKAVEYLCDHTRTHRYVQGITPICPNSGKCRKRGCVYARGREL